MGGVVTVGGLTLGFGVGRSQGDGGGGVSPLGTHLEVGGSL